MSKQQNIKVLCRIRPENGKEKESGCLPCIEVESATSLKIQSNQDNQKEEKQTFSFDQIFPNTSSQIDLFQYAALPIIKEAFEGVNGTLFCYGQTASGKTFTMEGIHDNSDLKGLIPRTMEYIFETIPQCSSDLEFSVKSSYYQIYNEKIQDLLDTRKTDLSIREDKAKGIWVEDCTEIYVGSKEEMYEVFQCGTNNRTVAATEMNKGSSRSHSLFVVTIFQRNTVTDSTKTGKIYFVDLAGSEKMSKTGITGGTGLKEAQNINKSLMTLGMVINALTENAQHVPYRDSKLTRVLQESIGGNSQTTLIITCSGNALNQSESLSTLRFGQRAKMIKNKVVANTVKSVKELLLQIAELEQKLKKYESGVMKPNIPIVAPVIATSLTTGVVDNSSRCSTETNQKSDCDQCNKYMNQLMNINVELLTLQEELDDLKRDKDELEEEVKDKSQQIYELNERNYLCEAKDKLIIDDEMKTYQEIQIKLDTFILFTQKKMLYIKQIRDALAKGKGGNTINSNTNSKISNTEDNNDKANKEMTGKILYAIQQIEDLVNLDSKNYSEIIELITGEDYKETNCVTDQSNNDNGNTNSNSTNINTPNNINDDCNNCRQTTLTSNSDDNNSNSYSNSNRNTDPNNNNCTRKQLFNSPIKPKSSRDNNDNLVQNQKIFIAELLKSSEQLKQSNEQMKLEAYQKDILLSKLNDHIALIAKQVNEKDEAIRELNEKIFINNEKFDAYKKNILEDFSKKEMKMIEMVNKISDLEDENYKLLHFNKDTYKKKFSVMDKQIKQFTIEMQKYLSENNALKNTIRKKEEETRELSVKIKDLEWKMIQSLKDNRRGSIYNHNNIDTSFAIVNSSFCTPFTGADKNYKLTTITDLLKEKLNADRTTNFPNQLQYEYTSPLNESSVNRKISYGSNHLSNINLNASNNNNNLIINQKIMKIIRGGKKTNEGGFFHKMLSSNGTNKDLYEMQRIASDKKRIEKVNREKMERELEKMDNDTSSFF